MHDEVLAPGAADDVLDGPASKGTDCELGGRRGNAWARADGREGRLSARPAREAVPSDARPPSAASRACRLRPLAVQGLPAEHPRRGSKEGSEAEGRARTLALAWPTTATLIGIGHDAWFDTSPGGRGNDVLSWRMPSGRWSMAAGAGMERALRWEEDVGGTGRGKEAAPDKHDRSRPLISRRRRSPTDRPEPRRGKQAYQTGVSINPVSPDRASDGRPLLRRRRRRPQPAPPSRPSPFSHAARAWPQMSPRRPPSRMPPVRPPLSSVASERSP